MNDDMDGSCRYQLGQGETWKVTKDREEAMIPGESYDTSFNHHILDPSCSFLFNTLDMKKVRQFEEVKVTDIAAGGNHSLFAIEYDGR